MKRSLPAQLGLICGIAAPLLATPAVAQEGMFFKNLLGSVGVIPAEKAPISYRDRPGLVVPPKGQLRTPGTGASAAGAAGWPNDPDVAARRRASADDGLPVHLGEKRRSMDNTNNRLTPQELQAGRVADHERHVPGVDDRRDSRDAMLLTPDQMRALGKPAAEPDNGLEPRRRALTDPPSGMRKWAAGRTTAGAPQPRVDQQTLDANPMNWLTSRFSKQDDD